MEKSTLYDTQSVQSVRLHLSASSTDHELMEAIQKDRKDAFTLLQKRYYDKLYAFVYRSVRHHEETEDLLQEIFYRVYSYRENYRQVASFSTWIHTIALNLMRSRFRKRRAGDVPETSKSESFFMDVSNLQDTKPLQDMALEHEEVLESLNKALQALPSEFRTALVLRDYLKLSYEEMATKTGVPIGTVKSRINRARKLFQKTLEKEQNQKDNSFSIMVSKRALAR